MLPHMIQGYLIGIIFPLGTVADQHTVVPPQLCQWSVISWALETVTVKTFSLILWLVNVYMWILTVSSIRYVIWLTIGNCMFSPNFSLYTLQGVHWTFFFYRESCLPFLFHSYEGKRSNILQEIHLQKSFSSLLSWLLYKRKKNSSKLL